MSVPPPPGVRVARAPPAPPPRRRYVYLPLEGGTHYLVLVTSKASNIIDDLDTLRLLAKAVPDQCQARPTAVGGGGGGKGASSVAPPAPLRPLLQGQALTEEVVAARAFEIVFAFDEIVASSGYREEVTLHQVRERGGPRGIRAHTHTHTRARRCARAWRWSRTRRSWRS